MRGPITPQLVGEMARLAGFDFAPERCDRLAPQLAWLLNEASRLEGAWLAGEAPAFVFRPGELARDLAQAGGEKHA